MFAYFIILRWFWQWYAVEVPLSFIMVYCGGVAGSERVVQLNLQDTWFLSTHTEHHYDEACSMLIFLTYSTKTQGEKEAIVYSTDSSWCQSSHLTPRSKANISVSW